MEEEGVRLEFQTLQAFSIVCYHCGPSHIATHAAVADVDDDKLFVDA